MKYIKKNVSEIGTVDFSNIKELNRDNLNYEILEFNDETKQLKLKIKEIEEQKILNSVTEFLKELKNLEKNDII